LVEQLIRNQQVIGSSPIAGSKITKPREESKVELAQRKRLPLATKDASLRKAAKTLRRAVMEQLIIGARAKS
jgi:hypothetical protein